MKVKQYPHYLFVVKSDSDSFQDENGNWNNATVNNVFLSKCREETNGSGAEIQTAGGTFYRYNALIQIPAGQLTQTINSGNIVFVANNSDGTDIRIKGTVLKYDNGQLHNRLWV
jgi:hypothetical protein